MQYVLVFVGIFILFNIIQKLKLAKVDDIKPVLISGKYRLIDVRTPREFSGNHIKNAKNIPVQELGAKIEKAVPNKAMPILLYCHSGSRAIHAEKILRAKGYENIYNLGSFHRAQSILQG